MKSLLEHRFTWTHNAMATTTKTGSAVWQGSKYMVPQALYLVKRKCCKHKYSFMELDVTGGKWKSRGDLTWCEGTMGNI